MISLNYRDSRPIYEQIRDGFKKLIATGAIGPDEKLPSVRVLATQLSINPNTIQRSYRQLEAEGWIVTVHGKGCFVSGVPQYALDKNNDLLTAFDRAVAALLQNGTTREELITRLQKEGFTHD